ncbi:MAG: NAD(P)/FAD-dependent oxidoreductase [Planctomycetota bacterium]
MVDVNKLALTGAAAEELAGRDWDVVVLGAGPSGCSAAALLAQEGLRVLLLEKEPPRRYSVGESLIPFCWYPLERLGLVDRLDASDFIVHKHSVQFVGTGGQRSKPYYFFQHRDHPSSRTWQVHRAEFDALLRENAVERGVKIVRGTARSFLRDGGAVRGLAATLEDGTDVQIRARMTVDASGRATFAQRENGWKIPDKDLRKVAIWTYFEGAKRDPGLDEGATTIAYLPDKGWFWYLPLACDVVSVGVVAEPEYLFGETRDIEQIFEREVGVQPWIQDHLSTGKRLRPCQVTRDFTYRSRHCAEDGLVLVGDAFSFLDPVFSSGVFLGLHSGVLAADAVRDALAAGDVTASRFTDYGRKFCEAIEAMRRLVFAFYDTDFNFGEFLKVHPEFRNDVTDCLIGDLHRDFDPLFAAMGKHARIPDPLPHGAPRTSSASTRSA